MAAIPPISVDVLAKTAPFEKKMRKAKDSLSGFAGVAKKSGVSLAGLQSSLTTAGATFAVFAAGATASLAAVSASFKEFASFGDDVQKMGLRTGLAAREVSQLAFAARRSGASFEEVEVGFRGLGRFTLNANRGMSAATDTLDDLGISLAQLNKGTPVQRFEMFAEALDRVEDPTLRAALAMQVFGKSGAKLLPVMAGGATGVRGLRMEADRLGVSMGQEAADNAAKLKDALDDVGDVLLGVSRRFAAAANEGNELAAAINSINTFASGAGGQTIIKEGVRVMKEDAKNFTDSALRLTQGFGRFVDAAVDFGSFGTAGRRSNARRAAKLKEPPREAVRTDPTDPGRKIRDPVFGDAVAGKKGATAIGNAMGEAVVKPLVDAVRVRFQAGMAGLGRLQGNLAAQRLLGGLEDRTQRPEPISARAIGAFDTSSVRGFQEIHGPQEGENIVQKAVKEGNEETRQVKLAVITGLQAVVRTIRETVTDNTPRPLR